MKKLAVLSLLLIPLASATTVTLQNGQQTSIGLLEIPTNFGMIVGTIKFRLGNYQWTPKEIVLLPANITPEEFLGNASLEQTLEIPENITFSSCRTAVYYNEQYGYGFKIYNTRSTTQILPNGTFCGLAYEGTYFLFAKY